jgi:glutamate formiminotransferase
MIECVPNFSEGRDVAKMRAIVAAIEQVASVRVLGWESDVDHNRSVLTMAGDPEGVMEAAIRGVVKAAELIDLNQHQGVHPRVGAADVVPFVPLEGSSMEQCVDIAHRAGEQIWRRSGVPVYFYESAARLPSRRRLENVRRRGFDGLAPDVGSIAAHMTAGASIVGARGLLIAFNVNLSTTDTEKANAIARGIRESSGGFRFVKAMGRYLASRGCAQVSMNLTNFAETPLDRLETAIYEEAARLSTAVESLQLVGFLPRAAYQMAPEFFGRAENFDESRVLENAILLASK